VLLLKGRHAECSLPLEEEIVDELIQKRKSSLQRANEKVAKLRAEIRELKRTQVAQLGSVMAKINDQSRPAVPKKRRFKWKPKRSRTTYRF
jgi:ribosomal 50S subunit-associated protein YjgA (DUF615 family)